MNSHLIIVAAAFLALVVMPLEAASGGDVAAAVTQTQWACAAGAGWQYTIVQAYNSAGEVVGSVGSTLAAAKAAGINYRDILHTPCVGQDPFSQVTTDAANVAGQFGTMWFDITTNTNSNCGWRDPATNCNFLQAMISQGNQLSLSMGVYTSAYMWGQIMGNCTVGMEANLPLWYAHYDDTESFNDFTGFGGWGRPAMKQLSGTSSVASNCGFEASADWYPN